MIQWNNLSFEERIEAWSQHRNDIYHTDSTTAKVVVSEFFRDVPICNRTLDYYTPENWPTPWEILHGSLFCKSGISLLIYYTLKINDPAADIDMTLIDDGSDVYVVPVVDGSVYNYVPGQHIKLEDIDKEIKILQVIDNQKIKSI